MRSTSITGTGPGSASDRLYNAGWFRKITGIDATQISTGTVTNNEFNALSGVISNIQNQLNFGISKPNVIGIDAYNRSVHEDGM